MFNLYLIHSITHKCFLPKPHLTLEDKPRDRPNIKSKK